MNIKKIFPNNIITASCMGFLSRLGLGDIFALMMFETTSLTWLNLGV